MIKILIISIFAIAFGMGILTIMLAIAAGRYRRMIEQDYEDEDYQ